MKESILDRLVQNLREAAGHNSHVMVKPEVILWPDPERQWQPIIPQLQQSLPALLVHGPYDAARRQGPAIWIKCMVGRSLPEANWPESHTPIIYLPGISKQDFKNITAAGLLLQPLMEYQYTGTLWLHENGKEWTVQAFVQNQQYGLGLKMAQDSATKDALLTTLPYIAGDKSVFYKKEFVDSMFLLSNVFRDIDGSILKWMSDPEGFMKSLSDEMRTTFINLCKTSFEFEPDYKNIKEIALKLGSRKSSWVSVWDHFVNAPRKYPKIPDLLRLAKPDDLGAGPMFSVPEDSWPQVNEADEDKLRVALESITKTKTSDLLAALKKLKQEHNSRKHSVWHELGKAPLVDAVGYLTAMAEVCAKPYPSATLGELTGYYTDSGHEADRLMRKGLAAVSSEKDRAAVTTVITAIYKPWLEKITEKFQALLRKDPSPIVSILPSAEEESFVLFVDALRYELAREFADRLRGAGYEVQLTSAYSALPTLTPTAKPFSSPLASIVDKSSECREFRPQLKSGKDLQTAAFRDALGEVGFAYAPNTGEIDPSKKTWMEIGEIDTKGHQEQANMVRRIDELFSSFVETLEAAMERGVKRIKVVTDHGWLLLPGGLPKAELSKHLAETRWGRCALLKDGAHTDLLYLPWRWNPAVFVAYAPGISFFKKNEAYAHGGLSLQECVIPVITVTRAATTLLKGKISSVKWTNLIVKIELSDADNGFLVDVRTKPADESSSIVLSSRERRIVQDAMCTLMVSDDKEGTAAVVVLLDPSGIIVDKYPTTVGQ